MNRVLQKIVSVIIAIIIVLSVPVTAFAATGYDRGYAGGMPGDGQIYAHGLDVSEWQAGAIDFNAVKSAGYDYVILRAGTTKRKDYNFEEFYTQAKAAGLNVGAYFYSYALTPEQSTADANTMLTWLAGKQFEYPIYFDYEDPSQESLSNDVAQAICLNFMDTIANAGYLSGMYTGYYKSTVIPTATICQKYEIWIAHYKDYTYQTLSPSYSTRFGMYQYTDRNYVNGKGPYDANVCFKDYPSIVKKYGFNGYNTGTSPVGAFDGASGGIGSVSVRGWALDSDDPGKSLDLYVSVGGPVFTPGAEGTVISSGVLREDVNNIYGCSGNHGYDTTIGTKLTGEQQVYVYAYDDSGSAEATFLGNKTVYITPDTEAPTLGEVVVFSSDENKYTVACAVSDNGFISRVAFPTWTEENPDNKIWYDGFVFGGVAYCDIPIADFNNYNGKYFTHCYAYDSAGNQTGNGNFSTTFHNPEGCVDEITESNGVIHLRGWALDKDVAEEPLEVHVYVGEPGSEKYEGHSGIIADKERTDVDMVHNCGPNHGFDFDIKTTMTGTQNVYVYAINKGNGGNVLIGKQTITISQDSVDPVVHSAEISATDSESFTVSCNVSDDRGIAEVNMCVWPDDNQDVGIWYKANVDVENGVATARIPIADFENHGGKYTVHIYAKDFSGNQGGFAYETTFNMPAGAFDLVEDKQGAIRVTGWALDGDAISEAAYVDFYIGAPAGEEGAEGHRIKADDVRSFADDFFNLDGMHGFDTVIETEKRGEQTVYAYVINIGNGDNVYLGSKTVTISEPPVDDRLIGDADGSGDISVIDVTRVQQIVAGKIEFKEADLIADVDGNGKLDIRDATLIQRYLAKYIDKFPAEG